MNCMRQEKRSARSSARLLAFAKLLTVPTVAVTVMTALFLSGCATPRKIVSSAMAEQEREASRTGSVRHLSGDSASEVTEIRTEAVSVPKSEVKLTIATDSLRKLPVGAVWREHSGQASVEVSRKAATATEPERIVVYASCDSLLLQCERYERQMRNLRFVNSELLSDIQSSRSSSQNTEAEEKPPNAIGTALKWLPFGIIIGMLITVTILSNLKNRKKCTDTEQT